MTIQSEAVLVVFIPSQRLCSFCPAAKVSIHPSQILKIKALDRVHSFLNFLTATDWEGYNEKQHFTIL